MANNVQRSLLFILLSGSVTMTALGCAALDEEGDFDDEDLLDEPAPAVVPQRSHIFLVEAKSFIRNIPDNMIGSFGDAIDDFNLGLLAAATNAQYSELPATGDWSAAQFRVWAHVRLDVVCTGTTPSVTLLEPMTDAGFEGLFKGEFDPLKFRSIGAGGFAFQAQGRPNTAVEPAFQLVHPRGNRTIWYSVKGHVACDSNAEASVVLDQVTNTNFPSLRIWSTHITGGRLFPEQLLLDRVQGKFIELWFLPNPPAF